MALRFIAILACVGAGIGRGQTVIDSVDVSGAWVGSLVHNSTADAIYGGSQSGNFCFAISCSSNRVISRFNVYFPRYLAYSSTSRKGYLSSRGDEVDSVLVIDGTTHQRIKGIPLDWANVLVWDSFSNRLYVSCLEMNEVGVIDCETDSVIDRIPVGAEPLRMYLNSRRRKLYVDCAASGRLAIVDLNTHQVRRYVPVPGGPESGCYCAAVDQHFSGGLLDVVVVDGAADTVVAQLALTDHPMSFVSAESRALVMVGGSHGGADSVYVIDAVQRRLLRALWGVSEPYAMVWSEATDQVYVASSRWNQVVVVAGDGSCVRKHLDVGDDPFALVLVPRHQRLYVGHLGSRWVYSIRDAVGGITAGSPLASPRAAVFEAHPNPFCRSVQITADCSPGLGRMGIYGADGRLVARLEPVVTSDGRQCWHWGGRDGNGREATRGVYAAIAESASAKARLVKLD